MNYSIVKKAKQNNIKPLFGGLVHPYSENITDDYLKTTISNQYSVSNVKSRINILSVFYKNKINLTLRNKR